MTPRKFYLIFDEFLEFNRLGSKKKRITTIDQLP